MQNTMQSIFRLPWYSDAVANKVSEKAALDKMRTTPVVEIPVLNKLKRKRTGSSDVVPILQTHDSKKLRPEGTSSLVAPSANTQIPVKSGVEQTFTQAPDTDSLEASSTSAAPVKPAQPSQISIGPTSHSYTMEYFDHRADQSIPMASAADSPMPDMQTSAAEDALGLTPLQQVIENEFNMQILMKHNELRLIEQELAKCQVALEQLRRCELRPYPGNDGLSESVSAGTGPSIAPPPGFHRPSHPAPLGVTDGPYSRHYRQWLLQDPQFDAMPVYIPLPSDPYGRSTRNSGSVRHSINKKFVFPGRPSADSLQSIPNYPAPPPKDKSAPLVLRRSTDNQLVKLICNNCNRGNFSSIQGFLNHCRIAHKVDYKSHDAAAIDCGRLLDENEVANLPPETYSTPASKPSMSRAHTANSTPMRNNLVHPLNTTSGVSIPISNPKTSKAKRKPIPKLNSASSASTASPFTPSAQVPRLSALFAKHQVGGDLESAATSARQKIDLGEEILLSPDTSEVESPLEYAAGARKGAGPGRAGMTIPNAMTKTQSSKGFRQPMQRPRPSPLGPPGLKQESSEAPESPHESTHELSPHTADSNPGLVSDHEDDDHGSASEEEAPHAAMRRPINVPGTCADNMEIDVAVDDDMDENGVIIRRGSMFAEDTRGLRGAGSPSRKLGMGKRG